MTHSGRDRELGLDRPISRRDFVQGAAVAVGGSVLGAGAGAAATGALARQSPNTPYPPGLTGLRGSHPGSFEAAHRLRDGLSRTRPELLPERYDLIVVGAGISGLSAAWFYQQDHPNARILLLDNHDDFGGHAKRNEFNVDGKQLIGYGGSQSIDTPSEYSEQAMGLLGALGVDLEFFTSGGFDSSFFARNGLRSGLFFDRQHYGRSAFVPQQLINTDALLSTASHGLSVDEFASAVPLDDEARQQLSAMLKLDGDALPDVSLFGLGDYLGSISYQQFAQQHLGVTSAALLEVMGPLASSYFSAGIESITALDGLMFGLPGLNALGVPGASWLREQAVSWLADPYVFHFPDGNATIARLLAHALVPALAPGLGGKNKALDCVNTVFDYSKLDVADAAVKIRLSSTAVNVAPWPDTSPDEAVSVSYIVGGKTYQVRGGACVMACYNGVIPELCPELPDAQREALRYGVKSPLVYTNVALRNWRAAKQMGMGVVFSPKRYHQFGMLDFPVSVPGYAYSESPDEPIVMHMSRALYEPNRAPRDGYRIGRAQLLGLEFGDMERELREHLAELFGEGDFDPARDIAGITVNRWPHGYAYEGFGLFDEEFAEGQAPHELGRVPFGRITIANSDAGASAYVDSAIDEAWRAVQELG